MNVQTRNTLALLIGVLSMTQLVGGLTGCKPLKAIGATLAMAPYPKVFSDADGLETFASNFNIFTQEPDGQWIATPITPRVYSRVGGSYNRRNVYGAALAYGPKLPEELRRTVLEYALDFPGWVATEMGLPPGKKVVLVKTKTAGRSDWWAMGVSLEDELLFIRDFDKGGQQ